MLHVRDYENTYEFYKPPLISYFTPKSGPSIGGTQMVINGLGLTPIKDQSGNPDKNKNKMWVRFVDPDSGAVLAPAYQVKPEDLNDD